MNVIYEYTQYKETATIFKYDICLTNGGVCLSHDVSINHMTSQINISNIYILATILINMTG